MKKILILLALILSMTSCEKGSELTSFDEFILGIWVTQEDFTVTRIQIRSETYVLQQEVYYSGTEIADEYVVYPEATYVTKKIGEHYFIQFNDFPNCDGLMRVGWDSEIPDVMTWARGENIPPLMFHKTTDF